MVLMVETGGVDGRETVYGRIVDVVQEVIPMGSSIRFDPPCGYL